MATFRYFRLLVTAIDLRGPANTFGAFVAELRLRASPAGAILSSAGAASASNDAGATFTAASAFDDDPILTAWAAGVGNTTGEWLQQDLGAPQEVQELEFYWSNTFGSSGIGGEVTGFDFQGSDDGSNWTTIESISINTASIGWQAFDVSGGGSSTPAGTLDLLKVTGGATSLLPGTSWAAPNGLFSTVSENGNTAYGWDAASSRATLPTADLADGYLVIGYFEFDDTSNGRHNPSGRFVHASGTGNFVSAATSGYNRDTSERYSYVRTVAFIDNPSAGAEIQFQWKRDTDAPSGGTVSSRIEVIPFWYDNVGVYASSSTACPGTTTPTAVTGWAATVESDTAAIELAGSTVSTKGAKRYFVIGSQYWDGAGGNTRTQRWHALSVDGSVDNATRAYSYIRNNNNNNAGEFFATIVDGAADLESVVWRGEAVGSFPRTGADVEGSTTASAGQHMLVVLELPDRAEVFHSTGATQQSYATQGSRIETAIADTIDFADATSFTKASAARIAVEQDAEVLVGGQISGGYTADSGGRATVFSRVTNNGSELLHSVSGDYGRGNQGSIDTWGWSASLMSTHAYAAGEELGIATGKISGGETGPVASLAGWVGAWGINLQSLLPSGDPGTPLAGTAAAAGTGTVAANGTLAEVSSAAAAGASSVSVNGALRLAGFASAAAASSAIASGSLTQKGVAVAPGASSIAADASLTERSTADTTGQGAATANTTLAEMGSASVSGSSSAAASGDVRQRSSASASGTSSASASGATAGSATASTSGTSSVGATGSLTERSSATASGTSAASASAPLAQVATATAGGISFALAAGALTQIGVAAASGESTATAQGALTETSAASAVGTSWVAANGSISGEASAVSVGVSSATANGRLTETGQASATGTSSVIANGALALRASASESGTSSAVANGTVSQKASASAVGSSTAVADGSIGVGSSADAGGVSAASAFGHVFWSGQVDAIGASSASALGSTTDRGTISAPGSSSAIVLGKITQVSAAWSSGTSTAAGDGTVFFNDPAWIVTVSGVMHARSTVGTIAERRALGQMTAVELASSVSDRNLKGTIRVRTLQAGPR